MEVAVATIAITALIFVAIIHVIRRYGYLFKPPLRVTLTPDDRVDRSSSFVQVESDLEMRGFASIGGFRVTEMPGLRIAAYSHSFQKLCAVVYRHPLAGSFIDVFSENTEGHSLTVSNAPLGEELDQPPGRDKVIDKSLDLEAIYDRIINERPRGDYKLIDKNNFVQEFEGAYAKEMEWRRGRGGVTHDEVRRAAQNMGINDEEHVRKTTVKLQKEWAAREHDHVSP